MSLPKYTPSHSSSPPRPSLRNASGTGNNVQKPPSSRSLLPSPKFEQQPLPVRAAAVEDENFVEGEADDEAIPFDSSPFRPFFTLIEDTLTQSHQHPTVHYIFADDDTDIVTEAACRSLAQDDPSMTTAPQHSDQHPDQQEVEESKLPVPVDGVRQHYLLLDIQPTTDTSDVGYEVLRAHSLSSSWQILSTSISNAPTIDAVGPEDDGDGLMLRIEGRGYVASTEEKGQHDKTKGPGSSKQDRDKETLEEMVARFEQGLAVLRRTIDAGGQLDIGTGSKQQDMRE